MPDVNTRITDYNHTITQMVEKGLLDIWGRLGEYLDFLVVIGGLVPRYITAPDGTSDYNMTTHCGTMDIDFGISLAVSDDEKYKEISEILMENGYHNRLNARGRQQRHSFVKGDGTDALIIDFLTPKYAGPTDSLMHKMSSELSAIQTKGLGLALREPRKVRLAGVNANGDNVEEIINVCRPAAFIPLKALAFDGRRKDKDIYDLVFVLMHYQQGVQSVVDETTTDDFASEYFQEALECLRRHFRDITYVGPAAYANFCDRQDLRALAFSTVQSYLNLIDEKITSIK
jgi:hypothetical protein